MIKRYYSMKFFIKIYLLIFQICVFKFYIIIVKKQKNVCLGVKFVRLVGGNLRMSRRVESLYNKGEGLKGERRELRTAICTKPSTMVHP